LLYIWPRSSRRTKFWCVSWSKYTRYRCQNEFQSHESIRLTMGSRQIGLRKIQFF